MRDMRIAFLLLAALVATSCDDSTGPETRLDTELVFVRPDPTAPPLADLTRSFWAKRGDNREIRMYYRSRPGRTDSTEFLRFRVDNRSLLRRPDGSLIAEGDSVLITVTAVNILSRLEVQFEPAGLRFDPNRPAELKIDFKEADRDFNDDGVVNSEDEQVKSRIRMWRRETGSVTWQRLTSVVKIDIDEVEALITGFSNYALAY